MRYFILFILLFTLGYANSQQVLTQRHRFGFGITSGQCFNFTTSDLLILEDKMSVINGYGFVYEYQHSDLLSFQAAMDMEFNKVAFSDNRKDSIDLYYYTTRPHSLNESPVDYDELIYVNELYYNTPPEFRQTLKRTHNFVFVSLPIHAVFRTKMRNFNRFYAKAGIRTNLCIRSAAREDFIQIFDTIYGQRSEKIVIRDVNRLQYKLSCGVGFERNYTGMTSIYVAAEFDLPINNTFSQRQTDANIFVGQGLYEYYPIESVSGSNAFRNNSLLQAQFRLKIGFLF